MWFRWRNQYGWIFLIVLVVISVFYLVYDTYLSSDDRYFHEQSVLASSTINYCKWDSSMPVFVNVKTKLGVNYDAGHWFHMAENLLVEHALLQRKQGLLNYSTIFYNFDNKGFIQDLNSITRFIIYLGTIAPRPTTIQGLHFSEYPALWKKNLKINDAMSIDSHNLLKQKIQSLSMSRDVKPPDRFTISPQALTIKSEHNHFCMKYVGTLGGRWPTPQRGSWFPTQADIVSFRQKIRDACPPDPVLLQLQRKTKKYKLIIYQRDLSRKLANEEEAIALLRQQLVESEWDIQVLMHSNRRSPCELAHILHNVDVFVTPHGFQSMLLLFLPRPSILFEIFPYKYYKRGYGPLSTEYGIIHSGVMSPPMLWHTKLLLHGIKTSMCMQYKQCRGYARNQDVELTARGVQSLVDTIRKHQEKLLMTTTDRDFLYAVSNRMKR